LLLFLLILAFFPSLFHYLWYGPVYLLSLSLPRHSPPQPQPKLAPPHPTTMWSQKTLTLKPQSRGSYLITTDITSQLPELSTYKVGLLNLFIQHTSCALSLNENWDSDVRADMSDALDRLVPADDGSDPKNNGLYRHDAEGSDDMPAHIKSALIGASVTVPIRDGKLALGTWQGVWYLEFREARLTRRVVATIQGEKY
jgi:secondary thiamine-phosphate synthase enzyme